ncbi:MAG: flagellar motor switch phosphatase FliY [Candidatus Carbobacillus altaicus]|nr:flagellar motor switch phosphatase FliY [Candidatus Carbobacillus altaicus]
MADSNPNDFLSQEEIDALLRGETEKAANEDAQNASEDTLSLLERDVLGEIGNISFGTASTTLSVILNQKVDITTPRVDIIEVEKFGELFTYPHVAVSVDYTDGLKGTNVYFLKIEDAGVIANLMMGGDGNYTGETLGELELSAVQEAMNQMMGSAATSMATLLHQPVNISPPKVNILDMPSGDRLDQFAMEKEIVRVSFRLNIGSLVDSSIMQLTPIPFAKALVSKLMHGDVDKEESEVPVVHTVEAASSGKEDDRTVAKSEEALRDSPPEQQHQIAPEVQEGSRISREPETLPEREGVRASNRHQEAMSDRQGGVQAAPVAFTDFADFTRTERKSPDNLDLLLDVPLQVTVELGRTKKTIKEILQFAPGSIIELDKLAGEPVDIFVNQKLIARGEVVVIDENFGVRLTHIVDQWERLKTLD